MSNDGSFIGAGYLRGLLPVLGAVTLTALFACGTAHAADDDDDDDDGWAESSTSTSGSDVEMWPPTSIGWPPLVPDGRPATRPIAPGGPPPGELPAPAPGGSLTPLLIVPAAN
ncbi:hypothetical protein BCA37_10045 [Mycobacterium sp. djl-10]|nr:hypothetical protein BCA37_10045 [Mycobacterium sp. djl-10]